MKVISDLAAVPYNKERVSLTIGNFDGVHLGHQALLKRLTMTASAAHERSVVITFTNHPSEVLRPDSPVPLLCTYEHKIKLIREIGIDLLIPLTFTKEFASQTSEEFLQKVRTYYPFSRLMLGPDATMGRDRRGDRTYLQALAKNWGFTFENIEELISEGTKVSSSKIRELIQKGNLKGAEKLLGRQFSIYTYVKTGQGLGKRIGFPTLNMEVEKLCLPPFGVYAVRVLGEGKPLKGVANLGVAPTVRQDNKPILEVHLLETHDEIKNESLIEVILHTYLRPEMRFANVDQLKEQISQDVQNAQRIL